MESQPVEVKEKDIEGIPRVLFIVGTLALAIYTSLIWFAENGQHILMFIICYEFFISICGIYALNLSRTRLKCFYKKMHLSVFIFSSVTQIIPICLFFWKNVNVSKIFLWFLIVYYLFIGINYWSVNLRHLRELKENENKDKITTSKEV